MNAMYLANSAGGVAGTITGVLLFAVAIIAYWIPAIVAYRRGVANKGSVLVVNIFAGWTVIGWVVALAMACRSRPQPGVPTR